MEKKSDFAHSSKGNPKEYFLLFRFGLYVHLWEMPKGWNTMISLVWVQVVRDGYNSCYKVWEDGGTSFNRENQYHHLCLSWTNYV